MRHFFKFVFIFISFAISIFDKVCAGTRVIEAWCVPEESLCTGYPANNISCGGSGSYDGKNGWWDTQTNEACGGYLCITPVLIMNCLGTSSAPSGNIISSGTTGPNGGIHCGGGEAPGISCTCNDSSVEPLSTGYLRVNSYAFSGPTGVQCVNTASYRCAAGYYGTANCPGGTNCSGCTPCPTVNAANHTWTLVSGSVTNPEGNNAVGTCFINSGASITESGVGTFTANGNCPYI